MVKEKENTNVDDNPAKKKCFVITPVGAEGSEIRIEANGIIKSVLEPLLSEKYEVKAAHLSLSSVQITKEIIQDIHKADLIIANLTGSNPNVMYELSLAHALRKPVIHIIKDGETPSFDISVHRYISYKNNMLGVVELREKLSQFIEKEITMGKNISNPITDAIDNIKVESTDRSLSFESGFENVINRLDQIEARLRRLRIEPNVYRNINKDLFSKIDDPEFDFNYKRGLDFLNENNIEVESFIKNVKNIEMLSNVLGLDVDHTLRVLERIYYVKTGRIGGFL